MTFLLRRDDDGPLMHIPLELSHEEVTMPGAMIYRRVNLRQEEWSRKAMRTRDELVVKNLLGWTRRDNC